MEPAFALGAAVLDPAGFFFRLRFFFVAVVAVAGCDDEAGDDEAGDDEGSEAESSADAIDASAAESTDNDVRDAKKTTKLSKHKPSTDEEPS